MRGRKMFAALVGLVGILAGVGIWRDRSPNEHRYDPEIMAAAAKYGMDPFLLKAVVWRESSFRRSVESPRHALGLTQVLPGTGEDWAKATGYQGFHATDLLNPTVNLEAGAWYLARAQKYWANYGDDAVALALAEYNAGRTNVQRWMNDPQMTTLPLLARIGYPETRRYVERVQEKAAEYRQRGQL